MRHNIHINGPNAGAAKVITANKSAASAEMASINTSDITIATGGGGGGGGDGTAAI